MMKRSEGADVTKESVQPDAEKRRSESRSAATVYAIVFFVFVMILMAFAYFAQMRQSSDTISDLTEQHSEFSIHALENIEELQDKNEELTEELKASEKRVAELEAELEKTKQDWAADVKNVEDTLKTDVAEESHKREAAEKLLDLYVAYNSGGDYSAELAAMESVADYLDGEYSELYKWILEQTQLQQTE